MIQTLALNVSTSFQNAWNELYLGYNIKSINNTAENGGDHIYGASLKSYCVVYVNATSNTLYVRSNDPRIQDLFQFEGGENSPISPTPSRVCTLNPDNPNRWLNFSESCADASQIFMTKDLYPGEKFELEVILVGEEFGSGIGDVFAQFLRNNHSFSLNSSALVESTNQIHLKHSTTPSFPGILMRCWCLLHEVEQSWAMVMKNRSEKILKLTNTMALFIVA